MNTRPAQGRDAPQAFPAPRDRRPTDRGTPVTVAGKPFYRPDFTVSCSDFRDAHAVPGYN